MFDWIAANDVKIGLQESHTIEAKLKETPLSGYKDSTKAASVILGHLSMIQQALRYGACYGVEDVILTDYTCGILMRVAPWMENATADNFVPPTDEVDWHFIDGKELRLVIASVLWKACRTMSKVMENANKEADEAEKRAKGSGN